MTARNARIVSNSNAGDTEKMYHNVFCVVPHDPNPNPKNPYVRVLTTKIVCPHVGSEIYVRKDCLTYQKA
jgi:IMP cyclohydrolase